MTMSTSTFTREGVQRILVGSLSAVARVTLKDQDGTRVAATGALTANLQRCDGTVLATGRATAAVSGFTGQYTVALTAAECATLDIIEVTWIDGSTTRATTFHRIVGGFLFGVDDLAASAGLTGVETADLLRARDWITDVIEKNTGTAWCPTYDVEQFNGRRCFHVLGQRPVRTVRSLTVDDVAQVVADVDVDEASGVISGVGMSGRCVVGFEHGYDAPPAELRDAALEGARDRILRSSSGLSDRIRSVTNDLGVTQQFSYPGPGHPTGIDSVDAAIRAHDHRLVGMA
jgi:hypothetical protein